MGRLRINARKDGIFTDYWHNGKKIGYSYVDVITHEFIKSDNLIFFCKEHNL